MIADPPAVGRPARAPVEYANRGWILAVMCLALVMVVAGVAMLANALPSIAADLDASQSSQQWIVDAYALTLAALLLPAGAVGDRFGRRGALIAGTAIFGAAAGLSAFSSSAEQLIALRRIVGPRARSKTKAGAVGHLNRLGHVRGAIERCHRAKQLIVKRRFSGYQRKRSRSPVRRS